MVLIYHLAEEPLWLGLMLTHRILLHRIEAQKEDQGDDNPADQPFIQPIDPS